MSRLRQGFTILELLLLLALFGALSAAALRPRSRSGQFRRTEELLRSYLQSVADQVRFRDSSRLFLLIGTGGTESGEKLEELLLAEGDGQPTAGTDFYLNLQNFGSVAPPDGDSGSDFGAATFAELEGFPGRWYAIPAANLLEGGTLSIVLQSADRVPIRRRFVLSSHGSVLSESL
ncbi:MAG: hypothetical protein LBB14_02005 [Puniceicoccales bacterium]|nr:hypothetical protein [Puniceicoccales bacterium]